VFQAYLVEIGLQEVHLLLALEKAGPELKLKVLLPEDELDLAVGVVGLAVLGVNLAEQVERDAVCYALLGGALEGHILFGDAESSFRLGNIGGLDVDVKVVALRLIVGGALSPCDYTKATCQRFDLITEEDPTLDTLPVASRSQIEITS
jgi:hypothetical protein